MDKRTAMGLENRIQREDTKVSTDLRRYDDGSWAVEVVDHRTGVPFVVHSPEEWTERVNAAEFGSTVDHLD